MNGIPTKLALKIHVCLKQHDWNTLACKQKGEYHSSRTATYNTTSCLHDIFYLMHWMCHFVLHGITSLHYVFTSPLINQTINIYVKKFYLGNNPSSAVETTASTICSH